MEWAKSVMPTQIIVKYSILPAGILCVLSHCLAATAPPLDDCTALVEKLKSISVAKGEYETTKEYEKRLGSLQAWEELSKRQYNFAEVEWLPTSEYNADSVTFTVYNPTHSYNAIGTRANPSIISAKADSNNRAGQKLCAITFANSSLDQIAKFERLKVKVPSAEAKEAKNFLSVSYSGKIVRPYYEKYRRTGTPIREALYGTSDGNSIVLRLEAVTVYNSATGKVLGRFPFK